MRKKEHAPRSTAKKRDERPQIESRDARERRHPGRRVVSCRIADLGTDPGCIAPGADIRKVGRRAVTEIAEAMAEAAALPDENLFAAARARTRRDDSAGKQTNADFPSHGA